MVDQISRATISIILNIAEGTDRKTDKDFAHFLNLAKTSLNEVVACLDIAVDNNYINTDLHKKLLTESLLLANQITAFRKTLIDNPKK